MKRVKVIQAKLRQFAQNDLFIAGLVFIIGVIVFFFELFMRWFPTSF